MFETVTLRDEPVMAGSGQGVSFSAVSQRGNEDRLPTYRVGLVVPRIPV